MAFASPLTWIVCVLAIAGVILRPKDWPEAVWAVAGATILVLTGLLPSGEAWNGIVQGVPVYMFLTGMMLLSELARREGLFDWLAACATRAARGSATKLFLLVYGVGVAVTVFLSNDATAVVLTPAVAAAVRAARVKSPLPYLLACAFVANAASFVLPISNPANLVVFGAAMPPLAGWLALFAAPALWAILATGGALYIVQSHLLRGQTIATDAVLPHLSSAGRLAGLGIAATATVLLVASARGWDLGLVTLLAGLVTAAIVTALTRHNAVALARGISWSILPLVAGLFVLVAGLRHTGAIALLSQGSAQALAIHPHIALWGSGIAAALATDLMNNLPAGLIAGNVAHAIHTTPVQSGALLLGIDLGPNLSVTGSLATILWLIALRREGLHVTAWDFLKIGAVVMPVALLPALVLI
jgi:arsenical pump membrane protein